jgi:hypothetical protein
MYAYEDENGPKSGREKWTIMTHEEFARIVGREEKQRRQEVRGLGLDRGERQVEPTPGIQEKMTVARGSRDRPSQFTLDAYQDQKSGAAFVTLSGKGVKESHGRCFSEFDSDVHLEVQLFPVANHVDVQNVSLQSREGVRQLRPGRGPDVVLCNADTALRWIHRQATQVAREDDPPIP